MFVFDIGYLQDDVVITFNRNAFASGIFDQ
jgi:hypothetical protein